MPEHDEQQVSPGPGVPSLKMGLKFTQERVIPIVFGVIFINFAFITWFIVGYIYLPAIIAIWILLVIGIMLVLDSLLLSHVKGINRYLSILGFFVAVYLAVVISGNYLPAYRTDELVTNTYAAYLFIHGKDPYINAYMSTEYQFYNYPSFLLTPLLKGGSVNYLIYPGLSVLIFVPTVLLDVRSYTVLVFFNVISMLVIYYYYGKKDFLEHLPLVLIVLLLNVEFFFYSFTGDDDIVWITFLGLSYVFRKNPYLSGLFFGLSLSFKQIGVVILPFYLYFLFRENDRSVRYILYFFVSSAATFFLVNLPFILMDPYQWLIHVLSVANQPIIGAGIGFSILSFAGFLNIPAILFAIYMILALLALLVIYLTYYDRMKYTFFVFPMIVFLFNYRTLENYIIYWFYTIFLILPDLFEEYRNMSFKPPHFPGLKGFIKRARLTFASQRRVAWVLVGAIVVTGGVASIGYEYTHDLNLHSVNIVSVSNASDPLWVNGNITELTVNIRYLPTSGPSTTPMNFRILTDTGSTLGNLNGKLWYSPRNVLKYGNNSINLYPRSYMDFLPSGSSFVLEAYYGNITSFSSTYRFYMNQTFPFQNPSMIYPTYSPPSIFPGWTYNTNLALSKEKYSYVPNGVNLSLGFANSTFAGMKYSSLSTAINFSYLADNNLSLQYRISIWNKSSFNYSLSNSTNVSRFIGAEITFNNGAETFRDGFSNVSSFQRFNSTSLLVTGSFLTLNFSYIRSILSSYPWNYNGGKLTLTVGCTDLSARIGVSFYDLSLIDGNGKVLGVF